MPSPILHIKATKQADESSAVVLKYANGGKQSQVTVRVPPLLSPEDQESIRWYLEDYRKFPFEPATTIARRTADLLKDSGEKLFAHLFKESHDAQEFWWNVAERIDTTRIEVENLTSWFTLPWEILWNPLDVVPLSCRAASFVRTAPSSQSRQIQSEVDVIRVLLVISRPAGVLDIPFRSIAAQILERVSDNSKFQFEVLRPSTFDALHRKLEQAAGVGRPYTIVHFDGHGVHEDRMATLENRPARRRRGYLLFESSSNADDPHYVNGPAMAEALSAGCVPMLILNACRSARADNGDENMAERLPLGSLADETLRAGQAAVVAMQYNIDVTTASKFVAALYEGLADRRSLSEAVRESRSALFKETNPVSLQDHIVQDWLVPVVFERSAGSSLLRLKPAVFRQASSFTRKVSTQRIVGNDDTLMELERAFQHTPIVVLSGQVGSGLSTLAAEFIDWNARTGAANTDSIVIDMSESGGLAPLMAAYSESHPNADSGQDSAAAVASWLAGTPRLYVLDNMGIGTAVETEALANILLHVSAAGCRVLLLTHAPQLSPALSNTTVKVHALEFSDRILLARAALPPGTGFDAETWRPILTFSQGNPGALTQLITDFVSHDLKDPEAVLKRARVEPVGLNSNLLAVLRAKFNKEEMDNLALATLFEGPISAKILQTLASSRYRLGPSPGSMEPLFERLSQLGLVSPMDGRGYYQMHPGLPGLLWPEFASRYSGTQAEKIRGAWVTFFSAVCVVFYKHGESGEPHAYEIAKQTLSALEPTLLRVVDEAKKQERWSDVRNLCAALRSLFRQEGRNHDWRRLASKLRALVTDPSTQLSRPGCESLWYLLLDDRIEQLIKTHSLTEAANLQERTLKEVSEHFALTKGEEALEYAKQVVIPYSLRMGNIRRSQYHESAAEYYLQALQIAQQLGLEPDEQRIASQLALLYLSSKPPDLEQASYWLTYASDLCSPHDRIALSRVRFIEGLFALIRSQQQELSDTDREEQITKALDRFSVVLTDLLPAEPSDERAACELKFAQAFFERWRNLPETMQRLQSVIAWYDADQNIYEASCARLEASRILLKAGEKRRAYFYAMQAARGFASLAPHAESEVLEATTVVESLDFNK